VKTTEAGGPRGYDAGKKIKGPQAAHPDRHQRPSGGRRRSRGRYPGSRWAPLLLGTIHGGFSWLRLVFADSCPYRKFYES